MSKDSALSSSGSSSSASSFTFTESPTEEDLFHSLRTHEPIGGFIFRRRDGRVTGLMEVRVTMIRYAGTGPKWWFEGEIVEVCQNEQTITGPDNAYVVGLWSAKKGESYPSRFGASEFALKENGT